ncbi:MAG: S1 family peptidase [Polyangiaceae bacterium]
MTRSLRLSSVLPVSLLALGCSGSAPSAPSTGESSESIIGGVDDSGGSAHPSVVMITMGGGACTATVIAPKLLITARHCVSQNVTQGIGCDIDGNSTNGDHVGNNYTPSSIKVYTGVNPQFWGSPVAVGAQLFVTPGKNLCNNDIALIVLNQAVAGVTPAKIRTTYPPQLGELVTAVGYGAINDNQMGSGTRRRRTNVKLLSVGKDWNELIGDGEIAATQSICSGDSGGPLFSAGGAIIGIASRSQSCSNPNDTPKFTRLDYHKALIEQAFAAAGGTPSLETGTGTPITQKPTGGAPCSTGAECTSYVCMNQQYCTEFCSTSSCPTGMLCQEVDLQISSQTVKQKVCTPLTGGTECETCRNTECVNVVSDCLADANCKAVLACADQCHDANCIANCKTATAAGADGYDSVAYCACNSSCATACATHCSTAGTGGAGGAAGAGGGGVGGAGAGGAGGLGGGVTGGGAGTGGSPGTGGNPAQTSGDSGGCSVGGERSSSGLVGVALALAGLAFARRRRV